MLDTSGNPIPDEHDLCGLILLSRHQVAFLDETHPKVVKIFVEVKFSQNKEGNFNLTSYRYAKPLEKIVSVKYDDEIFICLGVTSVKTPRGKIEGRMAESIDYTRKVIKSEEEFKKKIQNEIERVKKMVERSRLLTLTLQDIIATE